MSQNAAAPSAEPPEAVDASSYRSAMAAVAVPVHVVTTLCGDGVFGMTATAVCSVTDTPPRLLVCINRSASSWERFVESRILAVNTVTSERQDLAAAFAGGVKEMSARFALGDWERLETGAPILRDAIAAFDCRIVETLRQPSHDVFVCEVVALKRTESTRPLLYFDRRFVPLVA